MLCAPAVVVGSADPHLMYVRLALLVPLTVLLCQAGFAWASIPGVTSVLPRERDWPGIARSAGSAAVFALVAALFTDAVWHRFQPDYVPADSLHFVADLPVKTLFLPLILVVGPYAFGARLSGSGSEPAACAFVVGFRIAVFLAVISHFGVSGGPAWLLGAGVFSWMVLQIVCFRRHGYPGLAVMGLVLHLRHLAKLI